MCLGVFSVTANAEELGGYHVYVTSTATFDGTSWNTEFGSLFPNNGETNTLVKQIAQYTVGTSGKLNVTHEINFIFAMDDGSPILKKGKTYNVAVDGVFFQTYLLKGTSSYYQTNQLLYSGFVKYTDGKTETITLTQVYNKDTQRYNYSFQFKPTKNVDEVSLQITQGIGYSNLAQGVWTIQGVTNDSGYGADKSFSFSYDEVDEKVGLLDGIIGWVQNIFNSITNGFESIGTWFTNSIKAVTDGFGVIGTWLEDLYHDTVDGFQNMVDSIVALPSRLWGLIQDGLKKLFVPNDEYIASMSDEFDALLASRFGAIYQAGDVIFTSWENISVADVSNTIDLPVTTIPLPGGNEFSFGGYQVPIVPTGFEFLATICKSAVGMVAVLAFINGLRKKYDEIMGVEN